MESIISFIKGMEPQVDAAFIALIGVVISIIISATVSLIVSRRSSYIMAVTAERSKWIDKLRENIADLLGNLGAIRTLEQTGRGERHEKLEKLDRLIALITMQLNPKGTVDQNIIGLLALFPKWVEDQSADYRGLEKAFVFHSQFLLKEEWETVKFEAMGCLSKPQWYWKPWTRKEDYRKFCELPEALLNKIQRP